MFVSAPGCARRGTVAVAAFVLLPAIALAQTPRPPTALSMPADFAPAPFALPGSRPAVEKQLSSLLRRLEAVAGADVLISGQPPAAVNVAVILKPRPGRALTPELAERIATLALQAVPGATPQGLTITDSAGRLWYARGGAQAPAVERQTGPNAMLWLLAALVLAGAGTAVAVRRGRRPAPAGVSGVASPLGRLDDQVLTRLAAAERPEVRGVLLAQLSEGQAARLRRLWQRQGLAAPTPVAAPDPQVVQTIVQALQRRLP